jgi:hypothetical protein
MLAIVVGPSAGAPRLFARTPIQVFLSPSMMNYFFVIYIRTTPRVTAVPF